MALSRTSTTNRMLRVFITRQVLIGGQVHKPGDELEVDHTLYNDLIHSRKAVAAQDKTEAVTEEAADTALRNEERISAKKPVAGKGKAAPKE